VESGSREYTPDNMGASQILFRYGLPVIRVIRVYLLAVNYVLFPEYYLRVLLVNYVFIPAKEILSCKFCDFPYEICIFSANCGQRVRL
jgi:hypothetical protein